MAGCQQVIVADHGPTKAMELANGSVGKARALSLEDGVETVAIIIFAVYFDASKGLLAQYRDWLVGQTVVVDPSNPIALDGSGGFKKLIPPGSIVGTDPRRTASARGQVRQSLRDTCGAILED